VFLIYYLYQLIRLTPSSQSRGTRGAGRSRGVRNYLECRTSFPKGEFVVLLTTESAEKLILLFLLYYTRARVANVSVLINRFSKG